MNKETKNFSHIKGRLSAICNTDWYSVTAGRIYKIEFYCYSPDERKFVDVYDCTTGKWICRCDCERFTLLGGEL